MAKELRGAGGNFRSRGAFSGMAQGAAIGSYGGAPGAVVGAGLGLLFGGIMGGMEETDRRKAEKAIEMARITSVTREHEAMQQAEESLASGFKDSPETKSKSSSAESIIPDPIADANQDGFIGGGVPNAPSTSGTF